jgi:Integrase core domain
VANKKGTRLDPIEASRSKQLLCLDVWGPLSMTRRGKRFCLVAIDHFSKISYVKPISEIKWEIACFLVMEVSRAYRKYQSLLVDSGSYFTNCKFEDWAMKNSITVHVVQPAHP